MAENDRILVLLTGGTIDSRFEPTKDTIVPSEESLVSRYIEKLKLHPSVVFSKVCMKDSRELTLADRKKMLAAIKRSKLGKIIITHGTYTMADTAQYLEDGLKRNSKTIVLTGSMLPLEGFSQSDAPFNLGYALAQVQTLPKGVYICMNGKAFKPGNVSKNRLEGRFEEKK